MSVRAGPAEAELAMQSAVDGAAAMRRLSGYARSTLLQKAAQPLQVRQGRVRSYDDGRVRQTRHRCAAGGRRAIQTFTIAAEEAKRIGGEVVPLDWSPGMETYWGDQAVSGSVRSSVLRPSIFPNLVVHKVAPALAAGNSI